MQQHASRAAPILPLHQPQAAAAAHPRRRCPAPPPRSAPSPAPHCSSPCRSAGGEGACKGAIMRAKPASRRATNAARGRGLAPWGRCQARRRRVSAPAPHAFPVAANEELAGHGGGEGGGRRCKFGKKADGGVRLGLGGGDSVASAAAWALLDQPSAAPCALDLGHHDAGVPASLLPLQLRGRVCAGRRPTAQAPPSRLECFGRWSEGTFLWLGKCAQAAAAAANT